MRVGLNVVVHALFDGGGEVVLSGLSGHGLVVSAWCATGLGLKGAQRFRYGPVVSYGAVLSFWDVESQ